LRGPAAEPTLQAMKRLILVPALAALGLITPAIATSKAAASPSCPPGFAALQNSSTCVRISGRVRAESVFGSPRTRSSPSYEMRAGGRIELDVRQQTEYGPVRAVVRAKGERR
jgi:hypothetical protein